MFVQAVSYHVPLSEDSGLGRACVPCSFADRAGAEWTQNPSPQLCIFSPPGLLLQSAVRRMYVQSVFSDPWWGGSPVRKWDWVWQTQQFLPVLCHSLAFIVVLTL